MAEDLASEFENFRLTKEEETIIGNDFEENNIESKKISLMMVGKLLTNRPFNYEAMKITLRLIWRPKDGVAIRMVENNLFIFQFFSSSDKEKVEEGKPWFFDNQLLLLNDANGEAQLSEVIFTHSPCWIHLYDLPLARRNAQFAEYLGNCMGGFIEYDELDPLALDNHMRIKVLLDINKPLRRGVKIAISPSTSKWIDIKYERLGDVCYFCGKIGHIDKDCEAANIEGEDANELVYKYGPWLRASPLKKSRISKEELE